MVENLGFGVVSCGEGLEDNPNSGFQIFCDESVRFTHAYTPSTMTQPVIASLVTAKLPLQHGVRHNGAQALSAQFETVSELAFQNGYRTSFFSGGPPIWRRSGLGQGFEIFDDNIPLSMGQLYRPAYTQMQTFLNWQASEAPNGKFISFVFLSDLQFVDTPTVNELGEFRDSSYRGQLDEVDESLAYLVREMKRKKIWDATHVFLVGLNGYAAETRFDQIPSANLLSESTRVTLMIKPSRKVRDGPFNWKIDSNVSLVDVGATLFDIIGAPVPRSRVPSRPDVTSLMSALQGPEPDWDPDRLIVSETAWPAWRSIAGVRAAARKGPYLYLFDGNGLLFNTLTDNLELAPLPRGDTRYAGIRSEMAQALRELNYLPWQAPDFLMAEKFDLARVLWRRGQPDSETVVRLKKLVRRYPEDKDLAGWLAANSLRYSDWRGLKEAAEAQPNQAVWAYVASRNLPPDTKKGTPKVEVPNEPCLGFLNQKRRWDWKVPKTCVADGLSELITWSNESIDQSERDRAMESFIRIYNPKAFATRVAEQNYVAGLSWDVGVQRLSQPELIDLILALPEFQIYRSILTRRIGSDQIPMRPTME